MEGDGGVKCAAHLLCTANRRRSRRRVGRIAFKREDGMRKVLLVALLSLAPIAHAGGQSVVIAVGYNPSAPTAHVQISADFVAIQINVQSDARDPLKRTDEIEKALRVVAERVKQDATLSIRPGVVSLSPTDQSKVSSFSSGYDAGSSAQLYVLGALKPDTSVFAVTKRIYQTITAIP